MKLTQSEPLQDLWKGALAGFAATVPMTAVMWALDRRWRPTELRLPPEQIARSLVRRTGLRRFLNEPGKEATSWMSHFGYGTATGAAYPISFERFPIRNAVKGPLYGALVWAISYLGWLPALGIMPPARRQSLWRNVALVGSHLVWGLTCAAVFERLKQFRHTRQF
jgi:uncharacterized membrane protein YagU involved in acid resistance